MRTATFGASNDERPIRQSNFVAISKNSVALNWLSVYKHATLFGQVGENQLYMVGKVSALGKMLCMHFVHSRDRLQF